MKAFLKRFLSALCVVIALSVAMLGVEVFFADAARPAITVTNAVTGAEKHASTLQEAFDIAERGCFVDVSQYITLDSDVTLSAEVWLRGETNITFGEHKILLTGNGALFVIERLRTKHIGAANTDYSWIEMAEENGGYLYYLKSKAPEFGKVKPSVQPSGIVYGNRVDEKALDNGTAGYFYHDAVAGGTTAGELSKLIAVDHGAGEENGVKYAEKVEASFKIGETAIEERDSVPNGSTMVLTATNHVHTGSVEKTYTVILLGDVNGNGRVDAADAHLIALHNNGTKLLTDHALLAADANQDGLVNRKDATLLCEKYVDPAGYTSPLA